MKKTTLVIILASLLLTVAPQDANAFLLPPFKIDFVNSIQKFYTTVKTKYETAKKKIEESTFIQTVKQYGQGAKEAKDYISSNVSKLQDLKNLNMNDVSRLASNFKKIDKQKTEIADKAAQEAANETIKGDKKKAAIDKNIDKLKQDILENPEKASENYEKINKMIAQKEQITQEVYDSVSEINNGAANALSGLQGMQDKLMAELQPLTSFKTLAKNYDSTADLKDTFATISPAPETPVTNNIVWAYREQFYVYYWSDFNTAVERNTAIRYDLLKNNEQAEEARQKVSDLESASAAKAMASIEMKKENMLALLNYTELVLQRLKLNISHDLAFSKFTKINAETSISNFNFDNYKFDPQEAKFEVSTTEPTKYEANEAIPESIIAPSDDAFTAGMASISAYAEQERKEAEAAVAQESEEQNATEDKQQPAETEKSASTDKGESK